MTSQHDKDWEEYQLGQQGTPTGSLYNQMGLSDRAASQPAPVSSPSTNPRKTNTKAKPKAKPQAKAQSNSDEDFSPLFALIAFAATALAVYQPNDENGIAALVLGAIAGVLAGKLYKVILGLGFLALVLFVLSHLPQ